MNKDNKKDIKLLSIHIENFRCYENLSINFQASRTYIDELLKTSEQGGGLTVIVAKNGEGKTSLLDAINIGWGTFVGKMPDTRGQGFKTTDIKTIVNSEKQTIETGRPVIQLEVLINGKTYTVSRTLTNSEKKQVTTIRDAKILTEFAEEILQICNEETVCTTLPIIAYYGDNRIFADNVLTKGHIKAMLSRSRKYGYADSTNPKSGYKEFLKWYAHLQTVISDALLRQKEAQEQKELTAEQNAWQEHAQVFDYNTVVSDTVKKALQISGWDKLSYSVMDQTIYACKTTEHNEIVNKVPIDRLSAGTKAILAVVADLAYRCCTLNPHLHATAAMDTPGVVLIDEIDLHLHPSWQQQILPTLQNIFPNIQFIVTTHSPQVISSIPKECVRVISDGKTVSFDTPTQGVEVDVILAEIFGTDPLPQNVEIVQKLNRLHALLAEGKGDSDDWNSLFAELEHYYGNNYPPLQGALYHREFLRKRSKKENA